MAFSAVRAAAAVLLGLTALPVQAQALSLMQAYEAALRHDPAYRAAVHEHEAGQQSAAIGRSHLLPTLTASYGPSRNNADVTNTAVPGGPTDHRRYNSLAASIQLRQPLVHPEGSARYRQGLAQTAASDAVLAGRIQELIVRVVSLYTYARYTEDQLAQATAQRNAYAEQRLANERMFQRGEGTRTDLLETQARYDMAAAQVLEAADNVANGRAALAAVVGQEVTALDALPDDFQPRPGDHRGFDEWKAIALAGNPELQAQRLVVEIAREETSRSRAGHLPRLDLVASVGRNESDTINTFNQRATVRSVGLQLTVPLYAGGATTAVAAQALANEEKAVAELDGKTGQVLLELRKQFNLASSSIARLQAAASAHASARLLVEATLRSVAGGQRTNVDALLAQQQLYDARRELSQARFNHLLSVLRLRAAAGTLQGADLADVAAMFRPAG